MPNRISQYADKDLAKRTRSQQRKRYYSKTSFRRRDAWEDWEKELLINNNMTDSNLADELMRSVSAIQKQRRKLKMAKKLYSIFTDDMDKCYITGMTTEIERHHCLGSFNRAKSEKYNFIVPLHKSVHPNGASNRDKNWADLDHYLKRKCQEYYIENIGTREEWYEEFGRFYDDRDDERVWRNENR